MSEQTAMSSSTGASTGTSTGASTGPGGEQRSLGDIIGSITTDVTTLVRQELDLAKVELKEEAGRAAKGAGLLGGAGVAGHLAVVLASFTVVFALDEVLPLWAAALIVTGFWLVVAAVLALVGRTALRNSNPQLPQTQQTLQEDAAWARARNS